MWSLCGPGLGAGPGSIWVDGWGLELEQAPGHGDHQVGNGGGDQRRRLPPQAEQGPCRRCAGGTRGLRGGSGAPRQRPRKGRSPRRRLVPQLPSPSHSQSRPSAPGPSTACPPAWGSLSLPQMGVVSQTKGPDPDCRSPAREHPQVSRGPPSPQPGGLPAVQGGQASSPQEAPSSRAAPPHRVLSPKAEAGFAAPPQRTGRGADTGPRQGSAQSHLSPGQSQQPAPRGARKAWLLRFPEVSTGGWADGEGLRGWENRPGAVQAPGQRAEPETGRGGPEGAEPGRGPSRRGAWQSSRQWAAFRGHD